VTTDMAFECVLVSKDMSVITTMNRLLSDFSISTNVCPSAADAGSLLEGRSVDLVIVDFQDDSCKDLLSKIGRTGRFQRTAVLAIADNNQFVRRADILLEKPFWTDSALKQLRMAYSKMMRDHRLRGRVPLIASANATNQNQQSVPLKITDIGYEGIGFRPQAAVAANDVLTFHLSLPDMPGSLLIKLKVLWTRNYGIAGGRFEDLAPRDVATLRDWMRRKTWVKRKGSSAN